MRASRFSVVNLGCKVNRVESDAYEKLLVEHGWSAASDMLDLVVINTCTVTGVAEKKTRKAVRHELKLHPEATVFVTGCASAITPEVFEAMSDRVVVVSKAESLLRLAEFAQDHATSGLENGTSANTSGALTFSTSRTRVGVKVQDGCDNACTYCIVHVARGASQSRPLPEIVEEVKELATKGVREIVLSGINIGSYRYEGTRLAELLEILLAETASLDPGEPPVRFRVSSIEPKDVSDAFVELLARSEGRICRHLHLPLQSGSSKVLREMARPYDAEDFKQLVDYLRAMVTSISLSTDIIVGFPGETIDDFEDTLDMAQYCGFSKIHVFPYSMREGTPAAQRRDQIDPEEKSRRAAVLRDLGDELRMLDYRGRAGQFEHVLVERQGRGMSESYYEVPVDSSLPRGELVYLPMPAEPCSDCVLGE